MDVAVSTSDLHAEGSLIENTSAEMSPVARQANTGAHTTDNLHFTDSSEILVSRRQRYR